MTALNQDFTTYAGDAAYPQFTVKDGAGAPIDISTVSEITWNARRDLQSAPVLSKSKTGGAITLIGGGTTGIFQLALSSADTTALTGYYLHTAIITDSIGNISTVTLGRMQVGQMPQSSYSGDPSISDKDAVRYAIDDTNWDAKGFQLTDPEINFNLTQYGNYLLAGAACARSLASRYAKLVDKTLGPLSLKYGQRSKAYLDIAAALQSQGEQVGVAIYAGGISKSDMAANRANSDRVPPPFSLRQFDIPNTQQNPQNTDPDSQFNQQP